MNWIAILCIANWIIWATVVALIIGDISDHDKDGPQHGPPPIK